jgi:DNA replication protein DnaC
MATRPCRVGQINARPTPAPPNAIARFARSAIKDPRATRMGHRRTSRRDDNLLCFGLAGRGKSHFVAAVGREWIQRHQLQVWYTPTFRLVSQLLAAKRDHKLPQAIAKLQRFDAVILDDLGYLRRCCQ